MNNDPTAVLVSHSTESLDREIGVEQYAEALDPCCQHESEAQQEELAEATSAGDALAIPRGPIIPILRRRAVSGRYRSPASGFQVELRVDGDGARPRNKVSADFFQISGATVSYFGSFTVNSPVITVTATTVKFRGLGSFTFAAGAPVVEVTIARTSILQPAAPAVLRFFTTSGAPGATYQCAFESPFFRSVRIETDVVSDVAPPVFSSYNTASLPGPGPARTISVVSAFREAGIEMLPTAGANTINIGEAGPGASWSDAELHASMVRHFTLWRDVPQWAVWQVVCRMHDLGPGLLGIMFDQAGKQRQGCAVFHAGLGGTSAAQVRKQLHTYVHELGHCFNLLHSWQKSFANPPQANRPNSLSWMNYPWRYPLGGEAAFWAAFPFIFDDGEVDHLRHGFRNNVVMGGNNFIIGSGMGNSEFLGDPVRDDSALAFAISSQPSLALGEPMVLNLKLTCYDRRGMAVHRYLHPKAGLVQVAVRKPNGEVALYEPLIEHCVDVELGRLEGEGALEDSAYIGFGKDGFTFDQPGRYLVRALYHALDGSVVLSNELPVRVRYPVTARDEELAELMMGSDEQGALLFLLGSDSESLASGNRAFDNVLDRFPSDPMATYVRLVKGVNAGRSFKTIVGQGETRLTVRKTDSGEASKNLAAAEKSTELDATTKSMVRGILANIKGDRKTARRNEP